MKNVKFRGNSTEKDEIRGYNAALFRGKNPNSAAWLEIPRSAENCVPYCSLSCANTISSDAIAHTGIINKAHK